PELAGQSLLKPFVRGESPYGRGGQRSLCQIAQFPEGRRHPGQSESANRQDRLGGHAPGKVWRQNTGNRRVDWRDIEGNRGRSLRKQDWRNQSNDQFSSKRATGHEQTLAPQLAGLAEETE